MDTEPNFSASLQEKGSVFLLFSHCGAVVTEQAVETTNHIRANKVVVPAEQIPVPDQREPASMLFSV